jgi:hypothetical protein
MVVKMAHSHKIDGIFTLIDSYKYLYDLKFFIEKNNGLSNDKASRKANIYAVKNNFIFFNKNKKIQLFH